MKCNVGNADKTIRIAVGLILIVLSLLGTIGWWGYLGIIFRWATPAFGHCARLGGAPENIDFRRADQCFGCAFAKTHFAFAGQIAAAIWFEHAHHQP